MSVKHIAKIEAHIDLTPEEVAVLWWAMDGGDQARFFNRLGEQMRLASQLQFVSDSDHLSGFGRRAMSTIGEYAGDKAS